MAYSADGTTLATGTWRGEICLWCMETETVVTRWLDRPGFITLAFAPSGDLLVSVTPDGTTTIWDVTTGGNKITTFKTGTSNIQLVVLSQDGSSLAVVTRDAFVAVWRISNATRTTCLVAPSKVERLVLSSDAHLLVVGMKDSIMLHDLLKEDSQAVVIDQSSDSFHFLEDSGPIHTDQGVFSVSTGERVPDSMQVRKEQAAFVPDRLQISTDKQWIQLDGKDSLWLPPEKRPESRHFWISHQHTVVVATGSTVQFYTIE